jgi:hypothetical protein
MSSHLDLLSKFRLNHSLRPRSPDASFSAHLLGEVEQHVLLQLVLAAVAGGWEEWRVDGTSGEE